MAVCFYVVSGLTSSLLCAKAKVAPVVRPTLARLELSAVCLGVKMLSFVVNELRVPIERIVGWTDSLTTWHWISKPSYHWKTYVANRVAAVQRSFAEAASRMASTVQELATLQILSRVVSQCVTCRRRCGCMVRHG